LVLCYKFPSQIGIHGFEGHGKTLAGSAAFPQVRLRR
jgi:hypothetical protein